ncbi:MerR family transcriptional regulator [Nonomuraea terrae]|uniref:MerR family transcriptional regulator n=1 Tax=Nonomuraea terrae TaxID=2530383 RepID=A0A4R4XVX6_9ACTN|nr:MerR family transcriptional regulator [Nonomuraea terrae]TDD35573.1 MerR family transcriptional regulator [Nonomuraea terrae]
MKASHQETLSIGQAADRFGVAAHVLRHWEAMGLLAPARTRTGERRYSADDLYRIALIVKAKAAGFSLDALGEMFTTGDPTDRQAMLRQQRADLKRRIAELESSVHLLDAVLSCKHEDFARCPTFRAAVAEQP